MPANVVHARSRSITVHPIRFKRCPSPLQHPARSDHFEPLILLAASSAVTERIGLIAAAIKTYN